MLDLLPDLGKQGESGREQQSPLARVGWPVMPRALIDPAELGVGSWSAGIVPEGGVDEWRQLQAALASLAPLLPVCAADPETWQAPPSSPRTAAMKGSCFSFTSPCSTRADMRRLCASTSRAANSSSVARTAAQHSGLALQVSEPSP